MTTQLTPSPATQTVNFAMVLPLFRSAETTLVMTSARPSPLRLRTAAVKTEVALALRTHPSGPSKLKQLEFSNFEVTRSSGSLSRAGRWQQFENARKADLRLPPGMPRFVNASTLKRMLNSTRSDVLLKRVGREWEICENSARIDLLDDSVEFRMGEIQILS